MRRLVTRLVLSHLAVALLGAVTTFLLVRTLAPQLFDQQMHAGPAGSMGQGRALREQFAAAVDQSLAIGVAVGLLAAGALGLLAAYRLLRPLDSLGQAARAMAAGHYAVDVPAPGTSELDALAHDLRLLGSTLSETEARRTRLLGEVAHEMRTPLTVLDGHLEGMADGVITASPANLVALQGETRRLRRLSDDLSTLSRAEEGRLAMAVRSTDLCAVVTGAAERLRPQAEDAGVTLVLSVCREPLLASVDPDRVAQVVTNLVGNALRATPSDGRVSVDVHQVDNQAQVTVHDTGEGLSAADLDRVFERFYRVPSGRHGRAGESGSGIGLTISRGIALAHGGFLAAASPGLGQGATFTLTLPLTHDSDHMVDDPGPIRVSDWAVTDPPVAPPPNPGRLAD